MSDFKAKMHQICFFSAGALSQTPLGELTALPQTLDLAVYLRARPTARRKEGGNER